MLDKVTVRRDFFERDFYMFGLSGWRLSLLFPVIVGGPLPVFKQIKEMTSGFT